MLINHRQSKAILTVLAAGMLFMLTCTSRQVIDDDFFAPRGDIESADNQRHDTSGSQSEPTDYRVLSTQTGEASYYSDALQGNPTASGELYDREKLTAAHHTLPFGSICKITNKQNGTYVIVKINDRLPRSNDRLIDLSYKAMRMLDGIERGVITVQLEQLR